MLNRFLDWANASLLDNEKAVEYLLGRGVSEDQFIRHKIGCAVGDYVFDATGDPEHSDICGDKEKKHHWCNSCRYNFWSSVYDEESHERIVGRRVNGCIVLPLTDYTGVCVGFQVRSITEKIYDTFLLKKYPHGYFFGLGPNVDVIWTTKNVVLVEGAFDQLIFERLVSRDVVALTTSSIGINQLKFVTRFTTSVNSCLDLDAAGRKGMLSLDRKLSEFSHISFRDLKYPKVSMGVGLGDTKDLNEFWKRVGDTAFSSHFRKQLQG